MSEFVTSIPVATYMTLGAQAKQVYNALSDYLLSSADPQYQTLHKFRNAIDSIASDTDKQILINYFNAEQATNWSGMPAAPWEYYAKPY
jgi:hypothetical protein